MADKKNYDAGMDLRRKMWGSAGAEERVNQATQFNRPFEDLVTASLFGDVWQRPGLDHRMRSIVTLTALTALSKPNQLKMHVQRELVFQIKRQQEVSLKSAKSFDTFLSFPQFDTN